MRFLFVAVFVFAVCLSPAASAKEWIVDYAHSKLGFTGKQGDASFDGSFKAFETHIDFDPQKPGDGKISAAIDITGVTAGSSERDAYLPQADWFDIGKFPQAQFVSTSIEAGGACNITTSIMEHTIGCYKADGTLTIKGIAKPVTLLFYLTKEGDHYHAHGNLALLRNDFHIGEHDWASEAYVKYKVDVVVELVARPAT